MKNLTLLFALVCSISFSSQAQDAGSNGQIIPSTQNSFKIIYTKSGEKNVKIKLRDDRGSFIRIDRVSSNDGFMKRYDLSQLEPGTYTFEVNDKSSKSYHEVIVAENIGTSVVSALGNQKSFTIISEKTSVPVEAINEYSQAILTD